MISTITKKLIENIAYSDTSDFNENVESKTYNLVSLAVDDLEKIVPYITLKSCVLQPINETFNSAYIPGSNYEYFLGVPSPQLEINSLTYSNAWAKFKKKLSEAWIQSSKRLTKKREKQRKAGVYQEKNIDVGLEKYTLDNLLEDLQHSFAKFLSNTSIVYRSSNSLRIVGKDEFGANTQIVIYPTILEDSDYKFFISRKKGFDIYNFEYRAKCYNEQLTKYGANYIFLLKIFNYLFKEITKQPTNQVFIESLLYNCPKEFLKGKDVYDCFLKILNYLRVTDISDFNSVLTKGKKIFDDLTTKTYLYQYSKFLKSFDTINILIS